ncbi:MAG: hypothetical protein ACYC7D_01215 [Nitrososphaerales archaeon]
MAEKPRTAEESKWFSSLFMDTEKGNAIAKVALVEERAIDMCDVHRLRPNSPLSHRGALGLFVRKEYSGVGVARL